MESNAQNVEMRQLPNESKTSFLIVNEVLTMFALGNNTIVNLVNRLNLGLYAALRDEIKARGEGGGNGKEIDVEYLKDILKKNKIDLVGCFDSYLDGLEGEDKKIMQERIAKIHDYTLKNVADYMNALGPGKALPGYIYGADVVNRHVKESGVSAAHAGSFGNIAAAGVIASGMLQEKEMRALTNVQNFYFPFIQSIIAAMKLHNVEDVKDYFEGSIATNKQGIKGNITDFVINGKRNPNVVLMLRNSIDIDPIAVYADLLTGGKIIADRLGVEGLKQDQVEEIYKAVVSECAKVVLFEQAIKSIAMQTVGDAAIGNNAALMNFKKWAEAFMEKGRIKEIVPIESDLEQVNRFCLQLQSNLERYGLNKLEPSLQQQLLNGQPNPLYTPQSQIDALVKVLKQVMQKMGQISGFTGQQLAAAGDKKVIATTSTKTMS